MNKYSQRACAREKGILVGVRAQIQISKQRKRVAVFVGSGMSEVYVCE